ncbi:MAG: ATP-dependent RNA helicase HrpA [Deltaproteobacteria bacterium]|nr:ATP-dependent RNA helicase HrpA [Deltaproteobacteria bacterium]
MEKTTEEKRNYEKIIRRIKGSLDRALAPDRMNALRRLKLIERLLKNNPADKKISVDLDGIRKLIAKSAAIRRRRASIRPGTSCAPGLPIAAKQNEIIEAISANNVVIVSGATGSGKTTQLPKFCMAAGRGIAGRIGCTQPRRIAAVTVANRIAEETGCAPGTAVGYKIRFADHVADETIVKIMTDGILLAETRSDRYLNEYDTIIIDEAHERSLNIDFLLGLLKQILKKRRDLKLIITSATIDTEKFSSAFDNAPIIEVSGRMYPVEIIYDPPEKNNRDNNDVTYVESAVAAVDRLLAARGKGDILVFMPTQQDIMETCDMLKGRKYRNTRVLPLYARLSAARQASVFERGRGRKIVVATNVAETSITIPGIKYVVDTGLARIARYVPKTRATTLPISPISISSADQRAGRCGRVQNGVCIRLFDEEDLLSRRQYTPPEILRANLAEVVLRMMALKLGDIKSFEFVDPPPAARIGNAYDILLELGAIRAIRNKKGTATDFALTKNGHLMAGLPLDPRLSRMLIEAKKTGCMPEVMAIAAALTIPDPRLRDEDDRQAADRAHAKFIDPQSDFITLYSLWRACVGDNISDRAGQAVVRAKQLKQFSKTHHVSFRRMREWIDIHEQIFAIMSDADIPITKKSAQTGKSGEKECSGFSARYAIIHKAVLTGFVSNIAVKKEKNFYTAAHNREVMLFPGSGLFNQGGQWIVAAEMVETSRLFARTAAQISSAWIEPIAGDLCKYTHLNPRWDKSRKMVVADEQVSLHGLVIVANRTVPYGKIDPEKAGQIFIQSALIDGEIEDEFSFLLANRRLVEKISGMENKVRRRGILADEEVMAAFYEKRLCRISDIRSLRRKIRKKGGDGFLKMTEGEILSGAPEESELALFPDTLRLGDHDWTCRYSFNPGKPDDGITVVVPAAEASNIPMEAADWVVPGLLGEKITAMIRALPKQYRKRLVPVNETAEKIMADMPMYEDSLAGSLSRFIHENFDIDIPAKAWKDDGLADYLKPRFSIMDSNGKEIVCERNVRILRQDHERQPDNRALMAAKKEWEQGPATTWEFPDIPETLFIGAGKKGGLPVYPGLVPCEKGAALRLSTDRVRGEKEHLAGVANLYSIYFKKEFRQLRKMVASAVPGASARFFGGAAAVADQVANKVKSSLFENNIRTKEAFNLLAGDCVNQVIPEGLGVLEAIIPVMDAFYEAKTGMGRMVSKHSGQKGIISFICELEKGMERIVAAHFITLYDLNRMPDLVRYTKAVLIRAQRGVIDPDRDRERQNRVVLHVRGLEELIQSLDETSSGKKRERLEEFFWMIEEFKVSLFAQELGTRQRVSDKRLLKKYQEIARML